MSKDRGEYHKQYNRDKRIRISLNLSKDTDQDIIEAIDQAGAGNKQAGIKILIRKAIKEEDG